MKVIAAAKLLELGCATLFIVPSLLHMRDPRDVIKCCHECLLQHFGGKTTAHGTEELPWFVCVPASIHAK